VITLLVKNIEDDKLKNIKKQFDLINLDHTGLISAKELKKIFLNVNLKLSDKEIDSIINNLDISKSGKIN